MAVVPMMLAMMAAPTAAPLWEMVPPVPDYLDPCPLPKSAWGTEIVHAPVEPASNDVVVAPGGISWNNLPINEQTLRSYMNAVAAYRPKPRTVLYASGVECPALRRIAAIIADAGLCTPRDCIVIFGSPPRQTPPPPPPPPAPPAFSRKLTPTGSPQSWITNDDYPAPALRAGQSGTTSFRLDVSVDGVVQVCTVTGSSGSKLLDDKTCELLLTRARFKPALDGQRNPIAASWSSRMRWELPAGYVPQPTLERTSWARILQFTIGEDGAISGCTDSYFGTPGISKEDDCKDVAEMPVPMREAIRGNATAPVTIQLRYTHSVAGVPLPASPAIPAGFSEVGTVRISFDVSEAGEPRNCRETKSPAGVADDFLGCNYVLPYVPGAGPASVTITESWQTTGDPKLMRALRELGR